MRRKIQIPDEVRASIEAHIRKSVQLFQRSYDSTSSTEDSLTVKLGEQLNTRRKRTVVVSEGQQPGKWKWKLIYTKFSDRSRDSEEKHLGADGILEFTAGNRELGRKAVLFQCKKKGNRYSNSLEQAAKLSNWREAAFFLEFDRNQSSAVSLDDVVKDGQITPNSKRIHIDEFLIDHFLACHIGDADLEYFAEKKRLSWVSQNGDQVHARFAVKHRMKLEVFTPCKRWRRSPLGDELPLAKIQEYRMDSAFTDSTLDELKALTKVYHPDASDGAPEHVKIALQTRLREIREKVETLRLADLNKPIEEEIDPVTRDLTDMQFIDTPLATERAYVRRGDDE